MLSSIQYLENQNNDSFSKFKKAKYILYSDVQSLSSSLKILATINPKSPPLFQYVHQLLQDSKIYVPPPIVKPKNPELQKRLDKLRRANEDREYAKMVKDLPFNNAQNNYSKRESYGSILGEIGIGVDSGITIIAVFFVVAFVGKYLSDSKVLPYVWATIAAVCVLVIEVSLFLIRIYKKEKREKLIKSRSNLNQQKAIMKNTNDKPQNNNKKKITKEKKEK
ncbi:transmembrane protein [Anaeramoeba flamelloides]|nr:transmembrane protein [Anaeramoeba flamelloides]